MKVNKSGLFPRIYHAVFRDGILLKRRVSNSGDDVTDCLFLDGSAPRTILSSCLLLFTEERTATLPERRAIRRYLLHRKSEVNLPDVQIADSEPSGTMTELTLEPEIAS